MSFIWFNFRQFDFRTFWIPTLVFNRLKSCHLRFYHDAILVFYVFHFFTFLLKLFIAHCRLFLICQKLTFCRALISVFMNLSFVLVLVRIFILHWLFQFILVYGIQLFKYILLFFDLSQVLYIWITGYFSDSFDILAQIISNFSLSISIKLLFS